ncbi:MAG: transporter substrate-binding domain-containing protein [Armatimonadota bacterium]
MLPRAVSVSQARLRFECARLLIVSCACVALLVWPGCRWAEAQESDASAPPPIRSASEIDYPPFCIVDADGNASGFSVELMEAAVRAMDRTVTFRTGAWAEVRGWLERGEVDALPLVGRTPEREEIFDFTFPYMSLHGAIVVRDDETDIQRLEDLTGRQVAVMEGDNAEEFLRREDRGIEIRTTATFDQALRQLSEGMHDAVVIPRLVAVRLINEHGLRKLQIVERPLEGLRQDFCFAVQDGDRETLALLNEGLALVMADGTYRHLHSRWFAALQLPEHRRLVIGGDYDFPPFEYLDERGQPTGHNVELTRAIAEAMELDVEIRLGPWPEMREALQRGEIDALQGMFYSTERDLVYDFTPPFMTLHYVAVVREGEGRAPSTEEGLAGRAIVVQQEDIMHDFVKTRGVEAAITAVGSHEVALRELAAGTHDCALVARSSALYLIEKHGWENLRVGRRPLQSLDYCYAVPKGHSAVLAQLTEGLRMVEESGEYRRIQSRWMGVYEDEALTIAEVARGVAFVIVPLFVLLLLFALWSWSLRRRVAVRTDELRRSEQLLTTIIDAIPAPVFYKDVEGAYLGCNRAFAEFVGLPKEEIVGRDVFDIAPRPMAEVYDGADRALLQGGQPQVYEDAIRAGDGTRRQVVFHKAAFRGQDGEVAGIVGAILDITARKRAEEELREFKAIFDNANFGAVIADEGGRVLYVNAYHAGLHGYESEELIGRSLEVFHAEEERERVEALREALLEDGSFEATEIWHVDRDGATFPMLATGLLIHDGEDGSPRLAVTAIEISELKATQEQLQRAQRLEAIGRLAGGVAHDFNNMLLVIIGRVQMMMGDEATSEPVREGLEEIDRAAKRSADLTRQLLAFASRQTVSPRALDLNETVESMLTLLRRLIGEEIEIEWLPQKGLWTVKMDPAQVDQVLANLCVNARDAIDGAGKVTIETATRSFGEGYCAAHPDAEPGQYVMLAVSDDGRGMDEETVSRVFEPFFTTKGVGEGTGLGLATVHGIVRQSGGFVNVYSEPGVGTTFRIYIPRHEGEVSEEGGEAGEDAPRGRGEVVLLVEDDSSILRVGQAMLEQQGYEVLVAGEAEEALELAEGRGRRIDLLVTDVVMPTMNGRELAERLQGSRPDLRVLYMSGYTANVIAHQGVLEEGLHFMQKPFSVEEMARNVRAALDGRPR